MIMEMHVHVLFVLHGDIAAQPPSRHLPQNNATWLFFHKYTGLGFVKAARLMGMHNDSGHAAARLFSWWWSCIDRGSVQTGWPGHIHRVGQNHIYTVYMRYFWQGFHQIHGVYIRFWPTLHV